MDPAATTDGICSCRLTHVPDASAAQPPRHRRRNARGLGAERHRALPDRGVPDADLGAVRRASRGVLLDDGQTVTVSDPGPNKWFNTAAFTNAPVNALGTAGVGVIEGPDWVQCDITLRKVFKIRDGWTLRFTADAINAPNHTNFDNPNVSTSGGTAYGTISSAEPPGRESPVRLPVSRSDIERLCQAPRF